MFSCSKAIVNSNKNAVLLSCSDSSYSIKSLSAPLCTVPRSCCFQWTWKPTEIKIVTTCEDHTITFLSILLAFNLKSNYVIGITTYHQTRRVRTWKDPPPATVPRAIERGSSSPRGVRLLLQILNRWIAEKVIRLLLFCLVIALSCHTVCFFRVYRCRWS